MMSEKHALPHAARAVRTELTVRPARADDRAALEAIAAQTWDGQDYLPRVLEAWLADPHGGFFVAELRGRVVGAAKVSRLGEGEWWLEGLRVDPAFQGQGIGRVLHHFMVNQVRQRGSGMVRFSTGSVNRAVHRLARETGFRRELMCAVLWAPALQEPPRQWRPLHPQDLPQAWELLQRSAHFERMRHSLEWNWTFYRITQARLRARLAEGLVYGWGAAHGAALEGLLLLNPPRPADSSPALRIGYLDVPEEALTEAARDVRRLAAAQNQARVRIKPPKTQQRAFEQGGFAREWEGELWLYARDVVLTQRAQVRNQAQKIANDKGEAHEQKTE